LPKIALAPLFLLLFGLGTDSKVYFIATGIFFIPFFALYSAITTVDRTFIEHAKILGASRWQIIKDVYVPAIVGSVTASLRVAVSFSLLAAVIAELVASNSGIGFEINTAEQNSEPGLLIASIIIVALLGFILDRLLLVAERHFSTWKISQ
jgi:NitT/TauT family transport system permease protein